MVLTLDILTTVSLIVGIFFMLIGALGVWRLPDLLSRMHAGSKCITLGISGMLLASVFHFIRLEIADDGPHPPDHTPQASIVVPGTAAAAATKAFLVILFQFVAAPVAAHMLARAAHVDGATDWEGTLSDELHEDRQRARQAGRDLPPEAEDDLTV